jgi:hypothetical protein
MNSGFRGDTVRALYRGFVSTENGNLFYRMLDGLSGVYAAAFGLDGTRPSKVDHFLAVISPDRRATLYCNELSMIPRIRVNRAIPEGVRAGDDVYIDDIADVEEMELWDTADNPIRIPDEHGYELILSHGWRKALVFDYGVLIPEGRPRTRSVSRVFGHAYARLAFQEMYSLTDAQWKRLFEWGWFPFIGITHEHRWRLVDWAAGDRYPAPLLEEICRTFTSNLESRIETWRRHGLLAAEMPFLTTARDRFRAGDNVSCISVLYPRIEGLMRRLYAQENPGQDPNQVTMVANLIENHYPESMLLPERFGAYLREVYFRDFDLSRDDVRLSRNSHAHGVSEAGDYDFIRAAVGFMIVGQIAHFLSD